MTIVHYDYKQSRSRKRKPAEPSPLGRIVTARNPKLLLQAPTPSPFNPGDDLHQAGCL
jgi:hypothetical protein